MKKETAAPKDDCSNQENDTKSDESTQAKPPQNTLRVEAWRDLPSDTAWMTYRVTPREGEPLTIKVRKNNRRILEAVMAQPVLAASPVRISDNIHILKRDYGVNIETEMFENDAATDRAKFGVYFLRDTVEAVTPSEVTT